MKITISYKQTWVPKEELDEKLGKIKQVIEDIGHTSFVYHLDTSYENQTAKEIISKAKKEIETSDIVVAFINYPWKSEGMMQELWIAYGLNKKILVLVNKKVEDEYFLTYWLSTNTVFFDDFNEIEKLLKYNLPVWK